MDLTIGKEFLYVLGFIGGIIFILLFVVILFESALPTGLGKTTTTLFGSITFLFLIYFFSRLEKPIEQKTVKDKFGRKKNVIIKKDRDPRFWYYFAVLTGLTILNVSTH